MNKPILTIGIPTYNHGHFLKECLAAITAQFVDKDVFDAVEIFISDNASEDNTNKIVEEYQKRFSNIRYSRNEKNFGFDRNVDAVLSNAIGEFCWTLSSNEYLKPGSIARVLLAIRHNNDVALILLSNFQEEFDMPIRRFENGNRLLCDFRLIGGQVSQCIFRVSYLPADRMKYYGNLWFHLALLLEVAVNYPVLVMPYLFNTSGSNSICGWAYDDGGGQGFRTYIYLKRIVMDLLKYGYDNKVINEILHSFAKGLPRNVASAKRYGLPVTRNHFSLMVKEFYRYPVYLFISIGVFLTPSILLRAVKKMK